MTKVAVLGGGNGAHAMAADLSLRGFEVHMYEDKQFADKMKKVFDTREIKLSGVCGNAAVSIAMVTSELQEALEDVRYIFIAVPAFAHKAYAEKLAPLVRPGQIVFLLPGTFGSLIFWDAFQKAGTAEGVIVAETHTLPYTTRLTGEGEVLVMGKFNPLKLGVMPASKTQSTLEELSQFFDGLEACESVIACGLSSLNPIIHVPCCILNAGRIEYAKGDFFFYTEGFTGCVVRTTEAVDRERIALLKRLDYTWDVVAHGIGSKEQTDDLSIAIAGNPEFAKIKGPENLSNRYYTEDIPYGIALWAKLARQIGVKTPMIDSMVHLGCTIMEQDCWETGHSMADLGIEQMNLNEIKAYMQTGRAV